MKEPASIRGFASWAIAAQQALVKGTFSSKCDGRQFLADARFSPKSFSRSPQTAYEMDK